MSDSAVTLPVVSEPQDQAIFDSDEVNLSETKPTAAVATLPADTWSEVTMNDPMAFMSEDVVNNDVQLNGSISETTLDPIEDPLEVCNKSFLNGDSKLDDLCSKVGSVEPHLIEEFPLSGSHDFSDVTAIPPLSLGFQKEIKEADQDQQGFHLAQDQVSIGMECDDPLSVGSWQQSQNERTLKQFIQKMDCSNKQQKASVRMALSHGQRSNNVPILKISKVSSSVAYTATVNTMCIETYHPSDASDWDDSDWQSGGDSPGLLLGDCSPSHLPPPPPPPPAPPTSLLLCPHGDCPKTFKNVVSLRKHLTHHGPKRHVCATCGRGFAEASKLRRHSLVHTGERPHLCKFPGCGRRFSLAYNLGTHQRVHTGYRPFACPHPGCPKRFAQNSNLKHHLRVHASAV